MKNIYDQTGLAPVSVSIRGGAPRLIMKLPCLLRDHNFRTIGCLLYTSPSPRDS